MARLEATMDKEFLRVVGVGADMQAIVNSNFKMALVYIEALDDDSGEVSRLNPRYENGFTVDLHTQSGIDHIMGIIGIDGKDIHLHFNLATDKLQVFLSGTEASLPSPAIIFPINIMVVGY